jgi:hypothetical protein
MSLSRASGSTAAVIASTRELLAWTRGQSGYAYADPDWAPIADLDLEVIAQRFSCRLATHALPAGVQEIAIPGYTGHPTIVVNRGISAAERRMALRHGLAHLVGGELEGEYDSGVRFMSSIHDWMSMEERRADLYALADLVPDRHLETTLRADPSPLSARWWMESQIQQYAPAWPRPRLEDRARLRWRLFLQEAW